VDLSSDRADLVVVGAGTIGGWAACFARLDGADQVVVLDKGRVGDGASSRAAGIVRAQGGTPTAVALGRWSIDFYRGQSDWLGTDSGFRELGYLLLAVNADEMRAGRARVAMQREAGVDAQWLEPNEALEFNQWLDPRTFAGASYLATDGCIDPPRNVRAYSLALQQAGVQVREHSAFTGLRVDRGRVVGVETSGGVIATDRAILTGGPALRAVGELAGIRIPVGGVRHQVAVTEPHPAFDVERQAMGFEVGAGLYWRLEDGGLLFGMSNPDEPPGIARQIDWPYMTAMWKRVNQLLPITAELERRTAWAATIAYTPDHQPSGGPALTPADDRIAGVTIAAAGGHGMMWGPAVARIAADLALEGMTQVTDVKDIGLDRFDAEGRSRVAPDPIALPFPTAAPAAT
jgi:sarcosine oxidase subunit beta